MTEFGFRINQTLIVDIEPDEKVKAAMNEINANKRLRVATQVYTTEILREFFGLPCL